MAVTERVVAPAGGADGVAVAPVARRAAERRGRALERQRQRALEQRPDAGQELRRVGAVEDPVVAGERDAHRRAHDDLAVADDGPRRQLADREDRRLRRVDDRGEVA